jgi:hypothetical protein
MRHLTAAVDRLSTGRGPNTAEIWNGFKDGAARAGEIAALVVLGQRARS